MTASSRGLPRAFRRALIFSAILHTGLFILLIVSPSLSRPQRTGLVQYVNFIGMPGGGGPGGGTGGGGAVVTNPQPLPPAKKAESLRDLTVAEKVKPEDKSTLHYPTDKVKKPVKKTPEKKSVITKSSPSAATAAAADASAKTGQPSGQGPGFGLRFGTGGGSGGGTGGTGTGGAGGDQYGVSGFPFNYYLQIISDRITSNWFSSLVDPGVEGQFQAQIGFRIYRNGQIGDLKVEVSSGIEAFDISAQRAIQSSSPFPALPTEYDGQYLSIHLIFEHAK